MLHGEGYGGRKWSAFFDVGLHHAMDWSLVSQFTASLVMNAQTLSEDPLMVIPCDLGNHLVGIQVVKQC